MGKKFAYTPAGKKKAKKAAKSLLTAAQKKLPQDLQDKIAKSKMRSA
jgi:cbb3-type cytochrome oxidase subunit 3